MKACAEREVSVHTWPRATEYDTIDGTVYVNERNPHTITAVMDRVMQLPKVNA